MQEKLIKAMATRQKGGLEGEEGEPADLLSSLPQDAMLQVGRGPLSYEWIESRLGAAGVEVIQLVVSSGKGGGGGAGRPASRACSNPTILVPTPISIQACSNLNHPHAYPKSHDPRARFLSALP